MKKKQVNLFELAESNSDFLQEQYRQLIGNCNQIKATQITEFKEKLQEEWKLSINIEDLAFSEWLDSGNYKNIHEVKKTEADELINIGEIKIARKKDAIEEALKKHLKHFHESRTIFDSTFVDGKKFTYTALNMGGFGISRYGSYCIIIAKEEAESYTCLAFIKADSALHYVENKQVILEKLSRDIADKTCMPLLTALKHETEIETSSFTQWSRMICNNSDYIEAVTTDDINAHHIKRVRISKNLYDTIYRRSLLKHFQGEKISREELYRMKLFKHIRDQLQQRGIEVEISDEN